MNLVGHITQWKRSEDYVNRSEVGRPTYQKNQGVWMWNEFYWFWSCVKEIMKIPIPQNERSDFIGEFLRLFFDSVPLIFCIKTKLFSGIFLLCLWAYRIWRNSYIAESRDTNYSQRELLYTTKTMDKKQSKCRNNSA
jgi:hypothetical protein